MTKQIGTHYFRNSFLFTFQTVALLLYAVSANADHKAASWEYVPVVLPSLPDHDVAFPTSISNRGEVAGESWVAGGPSRVVVWGRKNSIRRELLPLPGDESSELDNTNCNAINARGEVVGLSRRTDGRREVVVWDRRGRISRVLPPLPGDSDAEPTGGINAFGFVAGTSYNDSTRTAVVWNRKGKIVRLLTPLAGQNRSLATGINNRGSVVGTSSDSGDRAVVWDRYGNSRTLEPLIGDGEYSEGWAINNRGQATGISENGTTTALVWNRKGRQKVLAPLDPSVYTFARDINDRGQVSGENGSTPVVWNKRGLPLALPLLPGAGDALTCGINNRGEVVGRIFTIGLGYDGVVWRLHKPH